MPKVRSFELAPLPLPVTATLQALGQQIVAARKERDLTQRVFSDMMGIAKATLVRVERGDPTVQIGHYLRALWLLERHPALSALGGEPPPPDPFAHDPASDGYTKVRG